MIEQERLFSNYVVTHVVALAPLMDGVREGLQIAADNLEMGQSLGTMQGLEKASKELLKLSNAYTSLIASVLLLRAYPEE